MRNLRWAGLYQRAPFNTVTFVNNHDLDAKNTRILNSMPLAYAMAATVPGLLGIYVKDWLDKLGYGYDDKLINALWFRHFAAQGEMVWRWLDHQFVVYERLGSVMRPADSSSSNNDFGKQAVTGSPCKALAQHWLHDYSGHMPDNVKTDSDAESNRVKRKTTAPATRSMHPMYCRGRALHSWRPRCSTSEGAHDLNYAPRSRLVVRLWPSVRTHKPFTSPRATAMWNTKSKTTMATSSSHAVIDGDTRKRGGITSSRTQCGSDTHTRCERSIGRHVHQKGE